MAGPLKIKPTLLLTPFALLLACATPQGPQLDGDPRTTREADDERQTAQVEPEAPNLEPGEPKAPPVDISPATAVAASITATAVGDATDRVVGWRRVPADLPYRQILDEDRTIEGSLSMGTTGRGELTSSAELDLEGDHHSVIERHRSRGTRFATEEMVALIEYASAEVAAQFPDSTLRVGNMSYESGGDIPWSSSHNSGRDADLAFYCKNRETGETVLAPDLLEFDENGVAESRPELEFDVERNWALVKALLTHPETEIQWIFVSASLKQMLLDHAQQLGEDDQLIMEAGYVLHQPTDAPPHADHFHLRVTCPRGDRIEGCQDWGPRWEWVDWNKDALLGRTLALREALNDDDPEVRLAALDFMERIRTPYAPEVALLAALDEKNDAVRLRALDVAKSIPYWSATAIVAAHRFVDSDRPIREKALAYSVLRQSSDPMVPGIVRDVIADARRPVEERALAARALAHSMRPELVPFLLEQLEAQPAAVRAELGMVLRRIANRSHEIDWARDSKGDRARVLAVWREWWGSQKDASRDDWLLAGFERHGFELDNLFRLAAVDHIIPMLETAPDHVAYNANETLRRITGRWSPLEAWGHERLHDYWLGWWSKNRERMLADK
ncbi:MAG: penicillin-insensitive murein endopeptidase [Myxococcota bacterium]